MTSVMSSPKVSVWSKMPTRRRSGELSRVRGGAEPMKDVWNEQTEIVRVSVENESVTGVNCAQIGTREGVDQGVQVGAGVWRVARGCGGVLV